MPTMMLRYSLPALASALIAFNACAAGRLTVTASHTLDIARPAETISIPWARVNEALPQALAQQLVVKDASGRVLPYQVTNLAPTAKDPKMIGAAYGELLFQHDFKAGLKSARFTIEKAGATVPPFPARTYARFVQERLDDFAWENDKLAHRTYGPALGAPAAPGSDKEVLVTSGLDIWFKRVPYMVVDRWYTIGHDHYHVDQGEGIDMYNVGPTRGAGGTGIWDGKQLFVGANFRSWKILANGPVRTVFELHYDRWDAGGTMVSEVKRFTVDAGRYFDRIDSTFTFAGPARLTAAVGLNKRPSDKGQEVKVDFTENRADGTLVQWVSQRSLGDFGVALIVPSAEGGYASDERNALVTAEVSSGQPLRYYVGAAWTRGSRFANQREWQRHVAEEAARLRAPVSVALAAER
jgi:pectinesterase